MAAILPKADAFACGAAASSSYLVGEVVRDLQVKGVPDDGLGLRHVWDLCETKEMTFR